MLMGAENLKQTTLRLHQMFIEKFLKSKFILIEPLKYFKYINPCSGTSLLMKPVLK